MKLFTENFQLNPKILTKNKKSKTHVNVAVKPLATKFFNAIAPEISLVLTPKWNLNVLILGQTSQKVKNAGCLFGQTF